MHTWREVDCPGRTFALNPYRRTTIVACWQGSCTSPQRGMRSERRSVVTPKDVRHWPNTYTSRSCHRASGSVSLRGRGRAPGGTDCAVTRTHATISRMTQFPRVLRQPFKKPQEDCRSTLSKPWRTPPSVSLSRYNAHKPARQGSMTRDRASPPPKDS
jgi:hypothetical protein